MVDQNEDIQHCQLCGRRVAKLTRHHLVPRTTHGSRAAKVRFEKDQMRENIAMLCSPCHKTIHAFCDEKELMSTYNTIEVLLRHEKIAAFVNWIKKRPDSGNIRVKTSGDKKQRRDKNSRKR